MKTYASHATALAFGDLKQAALYFDRVVPLFHFSRWDESDGDLDLKTWVHLLTGKSSVTDDQDSIVQAWRSQTAIESRVEEIADMVMDQTSTLPESVRTVRLQRPNDWESLFRGSAHSALKGTTIGLRLCWGISCSRRMGERFKIWLEKN